MEIDFLKDRVTINIKREIIVNIVFEIIIDDLKLLKNRRAIF